MPNAQPKSDELKKYYIKIIIMYIKIIIMKK
jgi:hypothetical protein